MLKKNKKNLTYIDTLDTVDKLCFIDVAYEGTEQELVEKINKKEGMIHLIGDDEEGDNAASLWVRAENVSSVSIYNPQKGLPESHVVKITSDGTIIPDPHEDERGNVDVTKEGTYHGSTLVFSKNKEGQVTAEEVQTNKTNSKALDAVDQDKLKVLEDAVLNYMDNTASSLGTLVGGTLRKVIDKRGINLPAENIMDMFFNIITSLIITRMITVELPEDEDTLKEDIDFNAMISVGIVMDLLSYLYYKVEDDDEIEEILSMDVQSLVIWIVTNINKI